MKEFGRNDVADKGLTLEFFLRGYLSFFLSPFCVPHLLRDHSDPDQTTIGMTPRNVVI